MIGLFFSWLSYGVDRWGAVLSFIVLVIAVAWGQRLLWRHILGPEWRRWRWRNLVPFEGFAEPGQCMHCGSFWSKHLRRKSTKYQDYFRCRRCGGAWSECIDQGNFTFSIELPPSRR